MAQFEISETTIFYMPVVETHSYELEVSSKST